MEIQDLLKTNICKMNKVYFMLKEDVVTKIDFLYDRLVTHNMVDSIACSTHHTGVSYTVQAMCRVKEEMLDNMSILLSTGYKPNEDSVGIDFTIYKIYEANRSDIKTHTGSFESNLIDENKFECHTPNIYFLLGQYIGQNKKLRQVIKDLKLGDDLIRYSEIVKTAIKEVDSVEDELIYQIYRGERK
nr:MAG TPA: hypothetical protein [Caudoviricetes sp.]